MGADVRDYDTSNAVIALGGELDYPGREIATTAEVANTGVTIGEGQNYLIVNDDTEITFEVPEMDDGGSIVLFIEQGDDTLAVTFADTILWAGGTPYANSTAAGDVDVVTIVRANGAYYGFVAGLAFA